VRNGIPAIVGLLAIGFLFSTSNASEKTYGTGKLLSINSPEYPLTIPPLAPNGPTVTLPMHLSYEFEIQQGDVVYMGYCDRRDYKDEWRVGDDVQFRLQKDKLILKRPNGKEFKLIFSTEAKLGPDGKPVTILSQKKR
jgi:hypothetical protein